MPAIKKILFPVDFSEQCERAAPQVRALADRCGARVTLLHGLDAAQYVFAAGEFAHYGWTEFFDAQKQLARKRLEEFRTDLFPAASTDRVLCEGEPGRQIVAHAHENQVDLIMMPSRGLGPFRRFLIGSVTAKVLHDAHCPVWTGVHGETPVSPAVAAHNNVLCAVDLGEQSDAALRWAADFVAQTAGKLTLVHAFPVVETRPQKYMDTEFEVALAEEARAEIPHLQKRLGTSAEAVVQGGPPEKVVHDVAMARNADLVVIARGSAAGGFGRLRSHAYSIIRNSPCPVVSV